MDLNQWIGIIVMTLALLTAIVLLGSIYKVVKKNRGLDERNQLIRTRATSESGQFTLIGIIILLAITPFVEGLTVKIVLSSLLGVYLLSWTVFVIYFSKKI
ncbi:hypothetical protein OB236_09845 [Paenibacillus sp. WQ 127069]|uniref:DUF2178 domain-containing protein n=1 Tax=Paenibacillus baimaensis TaxID=2982185 RepID=A0ABT2UCW0_9BACL|nr:hypothetical protein [Paenibacillus sp. WQ 127069]MCU6792430.1 hypothetical protein [Paenibacillus sp. WQ 127069]